MRHLPLGARSIHLSRQVLKNPYHFYDLGLRQPKYDDPVEVGGKFVFDPSINASKEDMSVRVKRVFGALGSREESKKEADAKAITVSGVKIPARPEEPTNCCMSGCVNCVWELYKDEIEEWRHQVKQARAKLMEKQNWRKPWPIQLGPEPTDRAASNGRAASTGSTQQSASSCDDDGFDGFDSEMDQGIRVFIETEKRLKARQQARAKAAAASAAPEAQAQA